MVQLERSRGFVMRKTSAAVYNEIEKSGLLSHRRWQVYSTLFDIGPATAAEISDIDKGSFTNPAKGDNSHARLNELMKMGVVEEVGERTCRITGKNVNIYDVTGNAAVPFVEEPSKHAQICGQYNALLDAIEEIQVKAISFEHKFKETQLLLKMFPKINARQGRRPGSL